MADKTTRAVPAILTGKTRPPMWPDYRQHRQSVYSLLGQRGYRFRNSEAYTQICPPRYCDPPGPTFLDPANGESPNDFGQRIINQLDLEKRRNVWINGLRRLRQQEFAMGHFMVPKNPHRYLPNGQEYRRTIDHSYRGPQKRVVSGRPGLLETYEKRILFQVGFADRLLGRIVNSIKKSGRWRETMLVVAGDHGFSLKQGLPSREVVQGNRHEIALTPLFIKYPNQQVTGRQEAMTRSVDILPTITDSLGLDPSYEMDGVAASRVPEDRKKSGVSVTNSAGASFMVTGSTADQFLESSGTARAERIGSRRLQALGPHAGLIGTRAPATKLNVERGLTVARLAILRRKPVDGLRPALVEGFVVEGPMTKQLPNNTRLLLALDGRFVSSATIYPVGERKAFAFLVHQRYLDGHGLGKVQIFRVSPSGKKIRAF